MVECFDNIVHCLEDMMVECFEDIVECFHYMMVECFEDIVECFEYIVECFEEWIDIVQCLEKKESEAVSLYYYQHSMFIYIWIRNHSFHQVLTLWGSSL